MGLNAVKMLGISITTSSKKEILEEVRKYLSQNVRTQNSMTKKGKNPLVIVTPNPEQIVYAQRDKHFREVLNQADVVLPDGVGVVWASRFLRTQNTELNDQTIKKVIPGVEFMEDLVAMAAGRGYPIALIGGRGGVAVEALECLSRRWPGLRGWAQEPGELQLGNPGDLSDLGEKIQKTNTRLVFVGLGAPKQEYFIAALQKALSDTRYVTSDMQDTKTRIKKSSHVSRLTSHPLVLMSVGGAFDIISGRTPRAPRAMQAVHLEWLWRLIRQPWRFQRQLALLKFFWLVVRKKLASKG